MAPSGGDAPVVRPRNAHDGPTPAGVSTLIEVLAMLWHLTGEEAYHLDAEAALKAFAGDAQRSLASHATYLLAATLLAEPLQVVIVGDAATPGFAELRRVAAGSAAPGRLILTLAPDAELPPTHPAAGKRLLDGRATAYVCTGAACEAPLTDAVALRSRLAA